MTLFLWIGTALGATVGLLHSVYLYREINARTERPASAGINSRGFYYAVWTVGLWSLFGSYILGLWLIGSIAKALVRFRRTFSAR
jgi:hypothetical protein